jgi:hypothetical protein
MALLESSPLPQRDSLKEGAVVRWFAETILLALGFFEIKKERHNDHLD